MKQGRSTLISVLCGVLCAACVAAFLLLTQNEANAARAEALARYGGEQVEVCVARRDIAAGERLDASSIEMRVWASDLLPEDPVRASSEVVGKTTSSSIGKGEVITLKRFEGTRSTLDVPAGKAAVSVPAKAVRAVGGAVQPGMSVDVFSSGSSETVALARDVLVLDTSVGESKSLSSSEAGWITLAVDPNRVEEVVAASTRTDLYFVLPGQRVEDVVSEEAARLSSQAEEGPEESEKQGEGVSGGSSSQAAAKNVANDETNEIGEGGSQ